MLILRKFRDGGCRCGCEYFLTGRYVQSKEWPSVEWCDTELKKYLILKQVWETNIIISQYLYDNWRN